MNDERKTKKELIAELEEQRRNNDTLRGEVAEKDGELVALRQTAGGDVSVVERQLAVERVRGEAMAMRSSEDIAKVVAVLWQEMLGLSIEAPGAA